MGEYTQYPNQLDTNNELPKTTDLVTPVKAEVTNRLRDAILAIEYELGTQPSSTFSSVKDRLNNISNIISTSSVSLKNLEEQVNLIKAELGNNPSAEFASVSARLDSIASDIAQLFIDTTSIFIELGDNPSGSFSTVKDRLENIESEINQIELTGNNQPVIIPFCYNEIVESDGYIIIGARDFDPSIYGPEGRQITFVTSIYTSNSSVSAELLLFNKTDGYAVMGTEIESNSLEPDKFKINLSVPDDLSNTEKRYEVHLRMSTASTSNSVFCEMAEFLITWS